jgi:hypothetical protein
MNEARRAFVKMMLGFELLIVAGRTAPVILKRQFVSAHGDF